MIDHSFKPSNPRKGTETYISALARSLDAPTFKPSNPRKGTETLVPIRFCGCKTEPLSNHQIPARGLKLVVPCFPCFSHFSFKPSNPRKGTETVVMELMAMFFGKLSNHQIPARGLKRLGRGPSVRSLVPFKPSNPRKGTETIYSMTLWSLRISFQTIKSPQGD